MGVVKKKVGGNGNGTQIAAQFDSLLKQVESLAEAAAEQGTQITESLQSVHANWTFPQAALQTALRLKAISDAAEAAYKVFETQAKKHVGGGGSFEVGKVAITFPESTQRRPSWKDEAVALATRMGLDAEEFQKDVHDRTPETVYVRVKLTESAG